MLADLKRTKKKNDTMKPKNIKTSTLFALCFILTLFSCSDAKMSKLSSSGDQFIIQSINCDGSVAKEWISTGKVQSKTSSPGKYYFVDSETDKLIEVTGRLIITQQ
jgi:hypothetical protein